VAAIDNVATLDKVNATSNEHAVAQGLLIRNASGRPTAECPPDCVRRFTGSLMKRPLSIIFIRSAKTKRSSRGLLEADLSYPALETHDNRHMGIFGRGLLCDWWIISWGDAGMLSPVAAAEGCERD
jgi:hypothetical protein